MLNILPSWYYAPVPNLRCCYLLTLCFQFPASSSQTVPNQHLCVSRNQHSTWPSFSVQCIFCGNTGGRYRQEPWVLSLYWVSLPPLTSSCSVTITLLGVGCSEKAGWTSSNTVITIGKAEITDPRSGMASTTGNSCCEFGSFQLSPVHTG